MNKEQKQIIFDCLVILKGGFKNNILEKTETEILDTLLKVCLETNEDFWNLVDENKKLKEANEILRNF